MAEGSPGRVELLLKALTEREAEALGLYLAGCSYEEASVAMGLSQMSNFSRLMTQVRRKYAAHGLTLVRKVARMRAPRVDVRGGEGRAS